MKSRVSTSKLSKNEFEKRFSPNSWNVRFWRSEHTKLDFGHLSAVGFDQPKCSTTAPSHLQGKLNTLNTLAQSKRTFEVSTRLGAEGHKSSFLPNSQNQSFYGFWHMRLKEAFNQAQTGQISFFIKNWPRNSIWGSLKIFQFFDHFATTWSQVGQLKTGPNRCFWEGSKIWTKKTYFYSSLRMVFLG